MTIAGNRISGGTTTRVKAADSIPDTGPSWNARIRDAYMARVKNIQAKIDWALPLRCCSCTRTTNDRLRLQIKNRMDRLVWIGSQSVGRIRSFQSTGVAIALKSSMPEYGSSGPHFFVRPIRKTPAAIRTTSSNPARIGMGIWSNISMRVTQVPIAPRLPYYRFSLEYSSTDPESISRIRRVGS